MRNILFIMLVAFHPAGIFSQVHIQPVYALKSHETLEINKIEISPGKTVISMRIENRIPGGQFCADRNIYMVYPDMTRVKMASSSGIPVCPAIYKFRAPGEKLDFVLNFPPLKEGTEWIDIIEECSENCFSFYSVVLDAGLNERIIEASRLPEQGETSKAIGMYNDILKGIEGRNHGIEGALYSDIIMLLLKSGNREEAAVMYRKLASADVRNRDKFLHNLNSQGIKF